MTNFRWSVFDASAAVNSIDNLVARARRAQSAFEGFSQAQVDAMVKDIGKYVYDHAEALARLAVNETGIGVYEDKVFKNKSKARLIWNNLKGKKSRGIICEDEDANMVLVAKPVGVVGALTPITNPIVTPMCNAMFALKTGNSIIFSPSSKARNCTELLVHEFMNIVKRHRGPDHLIQMIESGSKDTRNELMTKVDVIVATGGGEMVKSAYSSGRPSFGVGAGNVPVIIDRDANLHDAAEMIVKGASFDNGLICSREQFILSPADLYQSTIEAFLNTGRVWYTDNEIQVQRFRDALFQNGQINKAAIGRTAQEVGALAGVNVPDHARIVLLPARGGGGADVLAREKLCPVVAIMPYSDFDAALQVANANLRVEGVGHSAALHSHNEANIRRAGLLLPVSRLVVNQACALTAGGSFTNGFAATTTLGCGSWGGNSISENLDFKHLMNVSRIGKRITHRVAPTDAEIWS